MPHMNHTIKVFGTFVQNMSTFIWYEFGVVQWKIMVYREPVLELLDRPSYTWILQMFLSSLTFCSSYQVCYRAVGFWWQGHHLIMYFVCHIGCATGQQGFGDRGIFWCILFVISGVLQGSRVLVTGASSGIGEQIAYQYAKHGASVIITARREDRLKKVPSIILNQ